MTESNILQFGKHKGETFEYIYDNDRSYCTYILRLNKFALKNGYDFQDYIKIRNKDETELEDEIAEDLNIPSTVLSVFWCRHFHKNEKLIVGKWMMFRNKTIRDEDKLTELDRCFNKIKTNINLIAKCSTKKKNPNASKKDTDGVICIYTRDDNQDEIRDELKKLFPESGIMILYKYNVQTHNGEYSINGNKNISTDKYIL